MHSKIGFAALIGVTLTSVVGLVAAPSPPVELLKISAQVTNGKNPVVRQIQIFKMDDAVLYRLPLLNIDLDGAPNTYHPPVAGHPHGNGPGLGLDDSRNASENLHDGADAKWVGIATDSAGKPVVQKDGPFAGFYVSTTTLQDTQFPESDPRRYVDATKIPYVVLNPILRKKAGLAVGDLAVVVLNGTAAKIAYGIVADIGPSKGLGECSQALAASLGIPKGIEGGDLVYIFFPTPKNRKVRTPDEIHSQAEALFTAWGGLSRVQELPR